MHGKRKKYDQRKYRFIYFLLRGAVFLYTRLFLGYRCKDKYKIKKGESVAVLCNHQTDSDPFCVLTSFNRPVHPVATDSIFAGKFRSKFFSSLGVIAKKKGVSDLRTAVKIRNVVENGGSVLMFPEGNRSFCEFQFYISDDTAKLIKLLKPTLVLFNLHGGTGKAPRFKNKNRKGRFYGEIKRVLKYEEYSLMSDGELNAVIKNELKVFDSESGLLYKSKRRAEYLERTFFICPVCGEKEKTYSEGNYLYCKACGTKTEYTEDMKLKNADPAFPFTRMIDYWNYQKRYIKGLEIKEGKTIFSDKDVRVMLSTPYEKRRILYRGDISLTDKYLFYGDERFELKDIEMSSVVSGRTLTISYNGKDYAIRGNERFNPVKYALIFNKLDTKMKEKGADKYFNLEEDS